ncbi:MAG: anaerobic sulfatase maturase [Candidatus Latescibacteria bacterium]|jgi:uncharacterized protein|nr:anaerobic sulfatase maturase [Candidatus Latescibacterota bacterium]
MPQAARSFQVFAKPVGAECNLACRYCYYLEKGTLYPDAGHTRMPNDLLEAYIIQHIEASPDPVMRFSWHGGEPTLAGLDTFRRIVVLQRELKPAGRRIENGIQTNGILLDDEWCSFLSDERFTVGLSMDGPEDLHDRYRVTRGAAPTHRQVVRGYECLMRHGIHCDLLCVVHAHNVSHATRIYRYFKGIGARYITFLPLVQPDGRGGVSEHTMRAEAFGDFLCTIFDEWKSQDIGRVDVQVFEEAARTATGQDHALCIFRETCGDVPVVEHNGDFYSCDHFVDADHHLGNIKQVPLVELLENPAQRSFGREKQASLPKHCRECDVRPMCNGECPKNRFLSTPDGEPGLNYLCAGYKRFFTHVRPFLAQLAALSRKQDSSASRQPAPVTRVGSEPAPVRNDPCPCGSGLKYKKCCLRK